MLDTDAGVAMGSMQAHASPTGVCREKKGGGSGGCYHRTTVSEALVVRFWLVL